MDSQGHVIGIDLGTTNSVVAIIEGGEPHVIPNAEGRTSTPSVIAFTENGDCVVGELARRQAATQPERTISSSKRLIGRLYSEIIDQDEEYPFQIEEAPNGRVAIIVDDKSYTAEELSAKVLVKLKEAAEDYLGEDVTRAVVTVPAYFDDMQRQATMEAARLAGLEVLRLLNEPTAAAMAYGLDREVREVVAVYDFGGGTFDFSVLEIDNKTFEVLVSTGDSRLGGDDLDIALVDHVAEIFLEENGVDLRDEFMTFRRLKDAAEKAKCDLSSAFETVISLPFIGFQDNEPLHLEITITREDLETLIEPLVRESIACCERAMIESNISRTGIGKVILVGGSTRIPLVQDLVEDFFDLTAFKGLNPDEIVAAGAATQGAVMNGELDEVVLLDVTPHNLGLEVRGNRFSCVVQKNSTLPIKIFKTFTTTETDQEFVNIHILQGESEKATDCRSLGKFTLSGIEPAPRGAPRIRVTFFINADGIVEISAEDMASGREKSLKINHAYLNSDERRSSGNNKKRRRRRRTKLAKRANGASIRPNTQNTRPDDLQSRNHPSSTQTSRNGKRATVPGDQIYQDALVENFAEVETQGRDATNPGSPAEPRETGGRKKPAPRTSRPSASRKPKAAAGQTSTEVAPPGQSMPSTSAAAGRSASSTGAAPSPRPSSEPQSQPATPRSTPSHPAPAARPAAAPQLEPMVAKAGGAASHVSAGSGSTSTETAAPATPARAPRPQPEPSQFDQTQERTTPVAEDAPTIDPNVFSPQGINPNSSIPDELEGIVTSLVQNCADAATCEVYAEFQERFFEFACAHTADLGLQLLAVRMAVFLKQPDRARDILHGMHDRFPGFSEIILAHYHQLVQHFPNYLAARRGRADLAFEQGDLATAIQDMEHILQKDTGNDELQNRLRVFYEKIINDGTNPTIQFKLVKLHLRRQELDSAISLLQKLVAMPDYRDRANKVLGLCFWQKGMRYLAWQKFRTLPMEDELKDILYRLADDMEIHDELLHAKYCLERIYEVDIAFRDIEERLKKVQLRLELSKDDRYGGGMVKTPSAVEKGVLLGDRFEIVEEINRGSMGIVFKANDVMLEEIVALKVLNDFLCTDPQAVERFKQEARSARKLTHQNIVRIHDFYELDNKKAISMEYIEGDNLKVLLQRAVTFTEDIVLNYLMQICEGLAFAHRNKIVHRDIKPANIMITDNGRVKITDFGIAKVVTDHQTKNNTMIMGTPLYMAPEQIEGGKIDIRCDIYALGIMLYEMVTGRPPFAEGNIEYQHIHSKAPDIEGSAPDKLKRVIMKCIEKEPEKRFQSPEEILARIL